MNLKSSTFCLLISLKGKIDMFYTDLSNCHRTTKVPQVNIFQLNAGDVLFFKGKKFI